MAVIRILAWHGIPLGVKATDEDVETRENLPQRFQVAVDAVATATGLVDQKSYMAGFQWSDPVERTGGAREVAQAVAAELEVEFSPERVKAMRRELESRLGPSAP